MGKDVERNFFRLWSCRCTIPALPGGSWLNQQSLSKLNDFLLWFKLGTSRKSSKTANLSTETLLSAPAADVSRDGVVEICLPSGRTSFLVGFLCHVLDGLPQEQARWLRVNSVGEYCCCQVLYNCSHAGPLGCSQSNLLVHRLHGKCFNSFPADSCSCSWCFREVVYKR